ncbi:MAG TPA: long-chain fatty acid--CoA ligase [Vicinamibacterales bacterium]|jgi:fatty-acyl-CoA synthase|nr:long-chain fatty acid--CoA ligase [Vicinamibacterales bacterium]
MRGLMMDYQLLVPAIVRRAAALYGAKTVVSRRQDRTLARLTGNEVVSRIYRLAAALKQLGVAPGDRVATLAWATHQHLEAYLAIPSIGAVLHTLNLRLHPDDLAYIINDANDRVLILDECLLDLWEKVRPHVSVEHVIVIPTAGRLASERAGGLDYEQLLQASEPSGELWEGDERHAAAMCYTSGTTGRPKGVLYSHRSIVLHSLAEGLQDCLAFSERDTVLPIVPMFHVNAWGIPFSAMMFGSNQVFPGPYLDAKSVLELLTEERVTMTAGVPTVWLGVLQELDANPGLYDLSALRAVFIGGSAAPPSLIRGFKERHGIDVVHVWGMTELSPLGTVGALPKSLCGAPLDDQMRFRRKQGVPSPLVEIRARSENGFVPWDGQTMGELEVRGPWVASQYYNVTGADDRFTEDGWFKTGDIVTIDGCGCIELTDRAKDLVKSGGEWISSVALETALMGHPCVAEAAVVAVPHPKWDERPLAVVVMKPGQSATAEQLLSFIAPQFAKWWLPDAVEFASEIPRTSVGKFKKSVLREQFRDRYS